MHDTDTEHIDHPAMVRGFQRAGPTYGEADALQRQVAERLVERLEFLRLAPALAVDLGCGTGHGARLLARRFRRSRLLLIDLAPAMLRAARRRAPSWFSRRHVVCAEAAALPLAEASVDLIYSNLMLHWNNRPQRILAECRRVLRPDGLLLLSVCGPDTLCELRRSWAQVDRHAHVNRFMDMHELGNALMQAGFDEPVLDTEHVTLTYTDCRQLMLDLRRSGTGNRHAARNRALTGRRAFRDMLRAYEDFRHPDGRLPATYEIIYAHAWCPSTPRVRGVPGVATVPVAALRRHRSGA